MTNHQKDVGNTRDSTIITPAHAMIPPISLPCLFMPAPPDKYQDIICARPAKNKGAPGILARPSFILFSLPLVDGLELFVEPDVAFVA